MRFIVPDVFTVGIICPDILITTYGASVPSDQSSTGCEQVGLTEGLDVALLGWLGWLGWLGCQSLF